MNRQLADRKRLNEFLRNYGSFPIAYSAAVDDEIHVFETDDGFLPYAETKAERVILGDPLCAPGNRKKLIGEFIRTTRRDGFSPLALQCSEATAKTFVEFGFHANHMGVETTIHIDTFSTEGKAFAKVRRWINSARNAAVSVREESMKDPETAERIAAISKEWLGGKINTEELRLLTRPLQTRYEEDTRLFTAWMDGKTVAFVLFEPMYKGGSVSGYYANFVRALDCAPNGTLDLIYHEALQVFRQEGAKELSFGLSPLADLKDDGDMHNPIVSSIFNINYNYGNGMYAYQGLDAHKKAYADGTTCVRTPVYLVIGGALPINQILNVFQYIGILREKTYFALIRQFGSCILSNLKGKGSGSQKREDRAVPEVVSDVLKGVSTNEIAAKRHLDLSSLRSLTDKITASFKKLMPAMERQAIFFYGQLNEETEPLFVKVSNITDSEKDFHFVHNIMFIPFKDGYALQFCAEVSPEMTVAQTMKLTESLRKKIRKKNPSIHAVNVLYEPDGAFFKTLAETDPAELSDISTLPSGFTLLVL